MHRDAQGRFALMAAVEHDVRRGQAGRANLTRRGDRARIRRAIASGRRRAERARRSEVASHRAIVGVRVDRGVRDRSRVDGGIGANAGTGDGRDGEAGPEQAAIVDARAVAPAVRCLTAVGRAGGLANFAQALCGAPVPRSRIRRACPRGSLRRWCTRHPAPGRRTTRRRRAGPIRRKSRRAA